MRSPEAPSVKIVKRAQVLAYIYITNGALSLLLVCIEKSAKMGFFGGFWWVGSRYMVGTPLGMQ